METNFIRDQSIQRPASPRVPTPLPVGIPVCFHASPSGLRPALPDLPSSSPSSRLVSL